MGSEFRYIDEEDKSYGAAGMAIGMVVYKGVDRLAALDLDAEPWEMVEFFDEFSSMESPTFSAKGVWGALIGRFELEMAMAISNVMCRRMVKEHRRLTDSTRRALLKMLEEEGAEACSLEADEVGRLYNKEFNYLFQVFSHRGVAEMAGEFADDLRRRRRMTRMEVMEALRGL